MQQGEQDMPRGVLGLRQHCFQIETQQTFFRRPLVAIQQDHLGQRHNQYPAWRLSLPVNARFYCLV